VVVTLVLYVNASDEFMSKRTQDSVNQLRFISLVPSGAKVHARSRLVAVEARPQGTQVTQETTVHVVGQDKPALIYEGIFIYVKPQ
jgi:acyl dehydratase